MKTHPIVLGAIAALLVLACDEGPTAPQPGSLRISIATAGGDPDLDGYELVVGSIRRQSVTPNAIVVLDRVAVGTYVVGLEGIAENCAVAGTHPLSMTVPSARTVQAGFSVGCDATGIEITTRTTGADFPFSFDIHVDAEPPRSVGPNGSVLVSRLQPGRHTVSLSGVAGNCSVTGDNTVTVDVSNRAVTPVTFELMCVRTEKRIAFVLDSVASGVYTRWILLTDLNGSSVVPLTEGYGPAWSPDGARLVYSNTECSYSWDYDLSCSGGLRIIDPDTRHASAASNGNLGSDPSWSPDGNLVAFSRVSNTLEGLLLARLDGSPAVRIGTTDDARHPTWSPDGQRIVFGCVLGHLNQYEICLINRDGTGFMRLTNDAATDIDPAWSPDGSRIAFTTNRFAAGPMDVGLMTPSGTEITRLTSGFDPAWSPDGSKLVFARVDEGLFTIDSDGSNLTRITTGRHRAPAWRQ